MTKHLLFVLVSIVCVACSGPQVKTDLPSADDESASTIYLVGHGWHAGIVVPHDDIPDGLWPEHRDFPDVRFIEVGWGDSDYYRTPDPHWGLAVKAALLPTASVLHVAGFNDAVPVYFPHSEIIEIRLTKAGFEQLCAYFAASYARDAAGNSVPLGAGLYGNSRFYLSGESYHLFRNCNVWTARALRTAGCPVPAAGTLSVDKLMSEARVCGRIVQAEPPQK